MKKQTTLTQKELQGLRQDLEACILQHETQLAISRKALQIVCEQLAEKQQG